MNSYTLSRYRHWALLFKGLPNQTCFGHLLVIYTYPVHVAALPLGAWPPPLLSCQHGWHRQRCSDSETLSSVSSSRGRPSPRSCCLSPHWTSCGIQPVIIDGLVVNTGILWWVVVLPSFRPNKLQHLQSKTFLKRSVYVESWSRPQILSAISRLLPCFTTCIWNKYQLLRLICTVR